MLLWRKVLPLDGNYKDVCVSAVTVYNRRCINVRKTNTWLLFEFDEGITYAFV